MELFVGHAEDLRPVLDRCIQLVRHLSDTFFSQMREAGWDYTNEDVA